MALAPAPIPRRHGLMQNLILCVVQGSCRFPVSVDFVGSAARAIRGRFPSSETPHPSSPLHQMWRASQAHKLDVLEKIARSCVEFVESGVLVPVLEGKDPKTFDLKVTEEVKNPKCTQIVYKWV